MTDLLEDLATAGRRIAEEVSPSVVGVGRRGSGIVVAEGAVLTNAHNLRNGEVDITFADGRVATATVTAADLDGDLAVLSVDTAGTAPVGWADAAPDAGTPVFALANPGGRGPRISFGTVSSVGRTFRGPRGRRIVGSLEHTAPLPRGSSGGPVVDHHGKVVAVNTHRLDDSFYLALPVDTGLLDRLADLQEGRAPSRRSLGIAVVPPRVARRLRSAVGLPERDGVLVRAVDPDGPAGRADVREGDLVVAIGGRDVSSIDDVHAVLDDWREPSLELRVVRGADEITIRVDFA
jgi:serine protease Do